MKFGDRELCLDVYPNLSNSVADEKCPKKDIFNGSDPLVREGHPKEDCYVVDTFGATKKNTVKGRKTKWKKLPDLDNAARNLKMVDPVRNTLEDLPEYRKIAFLEAEGGRHPTRPP